MPTLSSTLHDWESGAILSANGMYRWRLWRCWNAELPRVLFIMLNPSTADAKINDATIRKCIAFAKLWGYGGIEVVNLFAYRATNPKELLTAADPIGVANDDCIVVAVRMMLESGGEIVAAWGKVHQKFQAHAIHVHQLVLLENVTPKALRINKDGSPGHPLYIPSHTELIWYE